MVTHESLKQHLANKVLVKPPAYTFINRSEVAISFRDWAFLYTTLSKRPSDCFLPNF